MLNFDNSKNKINESMKSDKDSKEQSDDRPYTFKITKRRSPWTPDVL